MRAQDVSVKAAVAAADYYWADDAIVRTSTLQRIYILRPRDSPSGHSPFLLFQAAVPYELVRVCTGTFV